jgi:purine-binding chemotaxis protein CheW
VTGNGSSARRLDWERVRAALARTEAALDEAQRPAPEVVRQVLEGRARRLAGTATAAAAAATATLRVACFELGVERYAIELRYLREVSKLRHIAEVPGVPDFVLGVSNVRGEMLSVFDLRRLLGVSARGLTDLARLLVLGRERAELGILVDTVGAVMDLDPALLAAPPETVSARGRRYLCGVTRDALIAIDGRALLDDPELVLSGAAPQRERT